MLKEMRIVITYVKRDENSYYVYINDKKTNKIVNSYCDGCETLQPNQMAHYDRCL